MLRRGFVCFCVFALAGLAVPSVAADRILFSHSGPTEAALYVSNPDGSGERPLAASGSMDYNPAWSPKGDWIAFTSERGGSADLYRVHPDGTGLDRLTDNPAFDDQAAFSPDGKKIVFVSTRADGIAKLWTLDVATHQAKQLTTGSGGDFRPKWSPDGQWIAFSSDRGTDLPAAKGRWERLHVVDVYIVHPDGSGLKQISKHGNFCGSPVWTANSRSIIAYCMTAEETWTYRTGTGKVEGENQLMQFPIAGGEPVPVDVGPGVKFSPAVLASGKVAYFRRDTASVGVYYADGSKGPAGVDVHSPSWSPDGLQVVYSRYERKNHPEPTKLSSRNPEFETFYTTFLPAYDPVVDRFAVTSINAQGGTELQIVDEGKPARSIYTSKELVLAPQWSADGKQMVFGVGGFTAFLDFAMGGKKPADPVNGGAQVAIIHDDGTGFRLLTSGPNNNAFPSFAPDGKHLVYRTAGPDGEGLRMMDMKDQSVTKLTDAYDNFPVWSPKGDLIAFIRRIHGDFEVFTIHPDGTGLKQLTDTRGNEAHLSWSPDGQRILFTSSRMGFKDEALYTGAPQPYGEIFVMRYDGTQVQQLTDNQWEEGGPAWRPRKGEAAVAGGGLR